MTASDVSVLLVEDDDITNHFTQLVCRKHATQVTHVSSALAALELLNVRRFDLLVLDHQLGGINGLQLLDAFRGDLANTAIMVMTANLDAALKVQYEERGCRLYLNKPLTLEALEFAVAAVIGKLRRERSKWPLRTS